MSKEGRVEYRVTWQRAGKSRRRAIYQTLKGAEDKVRALKWSDAIKDETPIDAADDYFQRQFASMPPLLEDPYIETRSVGEWSPA